MTETKNNARTARVVAICGMAMMWTCIHNQLMYPVTFTYIKPDAPSVYLLYLIYFCFALFTNVLIIIGHERIATRILQSRIAMVVIGCAGGVGVAALIFNDFPMQQTPHLPPLGLPLSPFM